MLYLPADRLEAISGERDWYFTDAVRSDPRTAPVLQAALDALWHCDSELAADGLLLRVCETLRPMPGPWRPRAKRPTLWAAPSTICRPVSPAPLPWPSWPVR